MNPRILILDEFTSSVDVATERLIRQALIELMRNRTTFVIAHRLSTVRAADQILVLEAGKLLAVGTHDELLATNADYRDTYALQLQSDDDTGGPSPAAPLPVHGNGEPGDLLPLAAPEVGAQGLRPPGDEVHPPRPVAGGEDLPEGTRP